MRVLKNPRNLLILLAVLLGLFALIKPQLPLILDTWDILSGKGQILQTHSKPELGLTYNNPDLGVKFDYPNDWKIAPSSTTGPYLEGSVSFLYFGNLLNPKYEGPDRQIPYFLKDSPDFRGMNITFFRKNYPLPCSNASCSPKEYLSESTDVVYFIRSMHGLFPPSIFKRYKEEKIQIGNHVAIRFIPPNGDNVPTPWTIKIDGDVYEIGPDSGPYRYNEAEQILNEILKTFKFTR